MKYNFESKKWRRAYFLLGISVITILGVTILLLLYSGYIISSMLCAIISAILFIFTLSHEESRNSVSNYDD